MKSKSNPLPPRGFAVIGLLLITLAGCTGREGITSYSAPKDRVNQAALIPPTPTRMLAAIVPWGEEAWFFKIMGPDQPVAAAGKSFEEFLASLRFVDNKPVWELPTDWKEAAGSPLRFATLQLPSDGQTLEMSVTVLDKPPGDDDAAYLLANVNRWRGQLNLRPLDPGELAGQSRRMQVAGVEATLIDYLGTSKAGGGMPPLAGMGGGGQPAAEAVLSYDKPKGWQKGAVSGLRKAAFTVADGEQQAEITIIDLAAAAGDLLPNVNRWRGQVSLGETSRAELAKALEEIKLGDVKGQYVKLIGPGSKAILGVIAVRGDRSWFVKLTGDAALAEREEERFKAFVQSIRFN